VIGLRKIISERESEAMMQKVVDFGGVPLLISLIKNKEFPQIRLESCWILTNIASGTTSQCQSIIEKNCL
jgi:hypothetical protein